jgi:hypothetical protein
MVPRLNVVAWLAIFSAMAFSPASASGQTLSDPGEKAWETIAARFQSEPEFTNDRQGRLQKVEVRGFRQDPQDHGWARVELNPESGRVTRFSSDRAGFTNEEFALFKAFTELERLTLWHNSNFHSKMADIEQFDGSGLAQLTSLNKLTDLTLAGGALDDDGMQAAARLPALKSLGIWHTRVGDAGMEAFRKHPTLEAVNLGPFWGELLTDRTAVVLGTMPKIRTIVFKETYLTWNGGLKHLQPAAGTLETVDLGNSLIEPSDVQELRDALPNVMVKWEGLGGAGKILTESGWHLGKARKWMPENLIERALEEAKLASAD